MGRSSSSGDTSKTIRYAPYIEEQHSKFLALVTTHRNSIIDDSSFANYSFIKTSEAFFGLGYLISSFSSLYDMFGKHMAGLDIEDIWDGTFERLFDAPNTDANILESMKIIDDEIVKGDLAEYQVSMRNINAISTSSFIVGKAVGEDKRLKLLSKMSLEAKVNLLDSVEKEYVSHINWEKSIVTIYATIMKDYFMQLDLTNYVNYTFASRNALWPFTVLSFEGYALGTMQSKASWRKSMSPRERSTVSKVLLVSSYTATGAMIGSHILPGVGTVIGGVVGTIVGIAMLFLE